MERNENCSCAFPLLTVYIRLTWTQRMWPYGVVTIVTDEGEDEEWHGAGLLSTPSFPPIPKQEEEAVDFFDEEPPGERAASQGYCHSPPIRILEVYSSTVEFITPIVVSVTRERRQMGGRNDCGREGECIKRVQQEGGGRGGGGGVYLLCSWLIIGSRAQGL